MEILNSSNINTKFINMYVTYPSIRKIDTLYANIQSKLKENDLEKIIKYTTDIINQTNDDDTYSLSFLISNKNKFGIFSTNIRDIVLDINNLQDMSWVFIKALYKNLYDKFYIDNKYINKNMPIIDLILKKEYNVPNDLYYINNFFFYRSFPIFNYLISKNKNNIISDSENKFDYNHETNTKIKNVLFDMLYTDDDINIYKKNIINLLNSNTNIFDYIIFNERDIADIEFINIKIDKLSTIKLPSDTVELGGVYLSLLYILNRLFNGGYGINNIFDSYGFFSNKTVIDYLKLIVENKKHDVLYYLLYISSIVLYFDFFNYVYKYINTYARNKKSDIKLMNEYLFVKNEENIKNKYKHVFYESSVGGIYCSYSQLTFSNVPSNIKKFFNTLKFIDNIKNSQQSKLLTFLSFSNTKLKVIINDDKKNMLLHELLNLHDFEKHAVIYPQKKL